MILSDPDVPSEKIFGDAPEADSSEVLTERGVVLFDRTLRIASVRKYSDCSRLAAHFDKCFLMSFA